MKQKDIYPGKKNLRDKLGRLVASSLCAAMALSLMACGGTQKDQAASGDTEGASAQQAVEGETDPRYPVTFTYYTADGTPPPADNKIYKLIEEELGVKFEFEFSAGNDADRIGVMVASGDYPDIICADTKIADAGGAVDITDKIQNYPNIMKLIGDNINKLQYRDTGRIYNLWDNGTIVGESMVTENSGTGFFIQKAVLAEFGYPQIKTLDEYFDLIEKYVQKYPEINGIPTIGYTILADGWRNFGLVNPPYFLAGYPNDGSCAVDQATMTAQDLSTDDIARKFYEKLNDVNSKGLLDPESCVMNYDQYMAKLSAGNVLGFSDQAWHCSDANKALVAQGLDERTYVSIPLLYDENGTDWYMDRQVLVAGWMITSSYEDPDRFLQFVDDICTEKWQKILNWGIEGEDYMVDENGRFYRTPEQRQNAKDSAWTLQNTAFTIWRHMPKWEGTYPDGNAWQPDAQPEEYFDGLSDYDKNFLEQYGFKTFSEFFSPAPENPVYYPAWNISIEDGTPAKIASTKCGDTKAIWLPQLIKCKPDEFSGMWDNYVAEYEACDPGVVVESLQETIDWRAENWK
ncbi:hypothetical protein [Eisenbergiella sp.]